MSIQQFNFPTTIKFGPGARSLIKDSLRSLGLARPLVVTDTHIAELNFFLEIRDLMASSGLIPSVYSGFSGNPVATHVQAGIEAFHSHGADCCVIIGGGAALDVGKAIALMVNHPGDLFDYADGKVGALEVDQPIPYILAVPTTAGTGSEVGRASVISDDQTKAKKVIFHPRLLPGLVIADPELTFGLPQKVTAQTGFDALTHNVEAFLAKGYHPICDGIALEGIVLIKENLPHAVLDGTNLLARTGMLMASMMGAIAFQKGLGVTHSCAHALSTHYDAHHGLANAVMLKSCMEFNIEAVPERFDKLAHTIGIFGAGAGHKFIDWIVELQGEVGVAKTLRELGAEKTPALIETAFLDPVHATNPRSVDRAALESIFDNVG